MAVGCMVNRGRADKTNKDGGSNLKPQREMHTEDAKP